MAGIIERINVRLNRIAIAYYRELQEFSQEGGYMHNMAQKRIQKKQAYNEAVLDG